ncbi:hypothetical protein [Lacticaseibacillus sp. N501-2]|uniref:hypothetical protein n=1 Tax=Lacticaseibacillus salsurae TaxID=3367729 RepID=UPI0038B25059
MSKNFTVKKTLYTSMTAIALLGAGAATTGVALMSQGATQTVHADTAPAQDPDSQNTFDDAELDAANKNNHFDLEQSLKDGTSALAPDFEESDLKKDGVDDAATDESDPDLGPAVDPSDPGTDGTVIIDEDGNATAVDDDAGASTDTPVQENTDTSTPAQDTTETPDNQGSTDTTSDNTPPIVENDADETFVTPEGYQFAMSAASNRPTFITGTHSPELNPGQTGDFFNLYDAIINAHDAGPSTGWTSAMVAALQEPYTNAERVFAMRDAPQTQIDAVTDALNSAVAALDAPAKVDKTDLNDTLSRAASYQSKEYVDATFQTLQNAIKAAQAINSDTHATQAQVDAASQAVQDAIKGLKSVPDQVISDPGATTDPDDSSSTTGEDGKDKGATAKDDGTSIPNFEEIDLKKDPNQFDQNGDGSDSTSTGDTPAKQDDSQKPTSAAKAAPKAKTSPKAKTDTKHNDQNTFPKTGEVATNFDLFGTVVIALSALLGITYKKQRN